MYMYVCMYSVLEIGQVFLDYLEELLAISQSVVVVALGTKEIELELLLGIGVVVHLVAILKLKP